ncbi:MAG: acyl-ACP--UDP-N-acetylglucosamine O-acyltransferase [Candidatus Omnitrophota bacterium]
MNIHKTAIISEKAQLDNNVEVGPYVVIGENVKIGSGTKVWPYALIDKNVIIGKNCEIYAGAIIGTASQDKKALSEDTHLLIGDNNVIREYVTINRATIEGQSTIVGNNNLLMAYCHIAHDCIIGDNVVIANAGTLAGHVELENDVILGGLAGVHQFIKIGRLAIIGGCSKVVKDIPPYAMVDGHPAKVYGINSIGLERAGFNDEIKANIKKAYRKILFKGFARNHLIAELEQIPQSEEIKHLIEFIASSERGIAR